MPNLKPYILTHLLSTQESINLSEHLNSNKKKRLSILHNSLKESSNYKADKNLIYSKVYKEDYTKEKDYLLRNDLRKLSVEIANFIRVSICKEDSLLEYYTFLLNKKAYPLFEKEIKKTIAQSKKRNDQSKYDYQKLYFEYVIRFTPRRKASLDKYHRKIKTVIKETPEEFNYYKTYFILQLSIIERIKWQYFQDSFTDLNSLTEFSKISNNNVSIFLLEKAKSYQLFGKERIDQLKRCLELLDTIHDNHIILLQEKPYLESQLGLEYFLLPEFKQSQFHFENAYNEFDNLNVSQRIQLIYNFSSMLCATEQFEKVIPLLEKNNHLFLQTPYENSIRLFYFMAHLLTNKTINLRNLLPKRDENESKGTHLYLRILECITLYYEGELELCQTYLENIYNTSRYNDNLDKAFIEFSKIFQKYLTAIQIIDKKDKTARITNCAKLSDNFIEAYQLGFGSNMLCSIWLNKEIKKVIQLLK